MTLLVCFAVKQEAQFFQPAPDLPHTVKRCLAGIGQANSEQRVSKAIAEETPGLVLTCGFAGGLNPSLMSGTVVFDADPETQIEALLLQSKATPARFHCCARIANRASEKEKLWRETGADAVEMESHHVRQICRAQGIPSATVRVILDTAAEDLPLDFNRLMNQRYELNYPKLVGRLLGSPSKILPLVAFQRQTLVAARRLGSALETLVSRIP